MEDPKPASEQAQTEHDQRVPVILLSVFDGLGTAAIALQEAGANIVLYIGWDTSEACMKVTNVQFPNIVHRGDFTADDVAQIVQLVHDFDPTGMIRVFLCAGPPCPDWSRIRGADAQGDAGTTGHLFGKYCEFARGIEQGLRNPVDTVTENVVFAAHQHEQTLEFDRQLQAQHVLIDAADFGVIRRPRLWWTRIPWETLIANQTVRSEERDGHTRILIEDEWTVGGTADIDTGALSFHPRVSERRALMPCLTTPAPDKAGRAAPRDSLRDCSPTTKRRWQDDRQQYAPWHYRRPNMMQGENGDLVTPPINVKEQMHMIPIDHTAAPGVTDRERHAMVANSWHAGVARFLFMILLAMQTPSPIQAATMTAGPHETALSQAARIFNNSEPSFELVAQADRADLLPPINCPVTFLQEAKRLVHPIDRNPAIDPTLQFAMNLSHALGDRISDWQRFVISDLSDTVTRQRSETAAWLTTLPAHVQKGYSATGDGITQIPIFIQLLRSIQYPGTEVLSDELEAGFPMLGNLTPGTGWRTRSDARYATPMPRDEFLTANREYIRTRIAARTDQHVPSLLKEVLKERSMGRIEGPFESPENWSRKCVTCTDPENPDATLPLQPMPTSTPAIAMSFVIKQLGSDGAEKLRRGEDWRRSHHNATVSATDVPHHHVIDHYVDAARITRSRCPESDLGTWVHDHEGAYRQLPLRDPDEAYFVLETDTGPTLWRHNVLLFGAVASVWSYNRFGDGMVALARSLLYATVMHYVDDFAGLDTMDAARASFRSFAEFNALLRLVMKESKAADPVTAQRILGVILELRPDCIVIGPSPQRIAKVCKMIATALQTNDLTPPVAATLGGKCGFLCTTVYGRCGRAATKPIYARQHADSTNHKLTHGLRTALITLQHLLLTAPPRTLRYVQQQEGYALLFADAYFLMGDKRHKPSDTDIPTRWSTTDCPLYENGWGCVIFPSSDWRRTRARCPPAFVVKGSVPATVLKLFCSRKAYIYFLETWAQIVTTLIAHDMLGDRHFSFVDNEAAKYALVKGYGSDPSTNGMIAAFWGYTAAHHRDPWFERVSSKANISDSVSRGDLTEARKNEWAELHLDGTELWPILMRTATDIMFACTQGAQELLTAVRNEIEPQLRLMCPPL